MSIRNDARQNPDRKYRFSIAITRQGAMAGARRRVDIHVGPASRVRDIVSQLLLIAAGSTLIGAGVGLYLRAGLGLPPYDVLLSAIREPLGITHGQTAWALAVVLFAVAALFGRPPTIFGLVFTITNGIAVDQAVSIIEAPDGLLMQVVFVAAALGLIAGGIAVATSRPTTGGPFDLLMHAADDRGFDPYKVRTALEMGVLVGGVVGGGDFGIATVAFALTIGVIIRVWATALNDHREGRAIRRQRDTAGSEATSHTGSGSAKEVERETESVA